MNTKYFLIMSGVVGGVIGNLLMSTLIAPTKNQRDSLEK